MHTANMSGADDFAVWLKCLMNLEQADLSPSAAAGQSKLAGKRKVRSDRMSTF
jgi:hypothetical protein